MRQLSRTIFFLSSSPSSPGCQSIKPGGPLKMRGACPSPSVSRTGGQDSERGSCWTKVAQRVGERSSRTLAGEGRRMGQVETAAHWILSTWPESVVSMQHHVWTLRSCVTRSAEFLRGTRIHIWKGYQLVSQSSRKLSVGHEVVFAENNVLGYAVPIVGTAPWVGREGDRAWHGGCLASLGPLSSNVGSSWIAVIPPKSPHSPGLCSSPAMHSGYVTYCTKVPPKR